MNPERLPLYFLATHLQVVMCVSLLLSTASVVYAMLYWLWMPVKLHDVPVYLNYGTHSDMCHKFAAATPSTSSSIGVGLESLTARHGDDCPHLPTGEVNLLTHGASGSHWEPSSLYQEQGHWPPYPSETRALKGGLR